MKSKKGLISLLLVMTMAFGTAAALTSCDKKKPNDNKVTQQFEDVGEYYCAVGESEWALSVTSDELTLTVNGQTKSGKYAFDGVTLSVEFEDATTVSATVDGNAMNVVYNGETYKFYKKVNYTVTFETYDGSAVANGTVVNGKTIAKPGDPTKADHVFIGWYEDSTFKTPYVFAKPVTSDITLYARFVKSPTNPAEFTVNFVVDGQEAFEALQTKDGVIYNAELPTPEKAGAEFVGWWVSDFDDAEKLTYKYAEQVLGQHTTLYAVWADKVAKISVEEKEITWTAPGVNNSYKVVVKNAAGEELLSRNTSTPKVAFDFAEQPAGEYTVEVSFAGKSATAYYNNKALDKVCVFDVTDSTVSFNAVANAEKYLITVDCANDEHQHTELDLGTSTYYNFDACDMQVGGIVFTVKAVAEGYISSTSEAYVVERTLNAVTELTVDDATETATWAAVENATAYVVKVENNGNVVEKTVTEASYSLKGMTGEIVVSVYPTGKGYNPAEAVSYTYTNARLAVPSGLKLSGQSVAWDAVVGAAKYNVKIGENVYETTETSLALTDAHFPDGLDSYLVSVQAVAAEAAKTSLYSDAITVNCNKMSDTLVYNNGSVSWDYVLGASQYGVKVNENGEEIIVDGVNNASAVTLTQSGKNVIYVRSYDATNEASDWVSVEVTANKITFVTEGEAVAAIYKVNGDTFTLTAESTRNGYNFVGWYDVANGPENNGTRIAEVVMDGDMTVYAGWSSKEYKVTFDLGDYGEMEATEATVLYAKDYELPTPSVQDVTKAFEGWYTQPSGEGFKYTNYLGVSEDTWKDLDGRTLYANYVDVFTFTLNEDDDNQSYSVAKADGTQYTDKITIPAMYNGLPVTRLDSEAFRSCSSLTEINIPDTVTTITMPNGGTATGSAFYICNKLEAVNIYCSCEDENAHRRLESRYASVDGILYYNTESNGMQLVYVPHARTGLLELPSEITMISGETAPLRTIPTYTMRNTKVTELVIPASVTKIEASAFYASYSSQAYLTSIVFAPAAEGEEELGLEIMDEAFYGQVNLTTLNLPARIQNFQTTILDGLKNLQNIEITGTAANAQYASVEGMLTNAEKTEILYVPKARTGAFTINTTSISAIGAYALDNCDGITSIVIPAHVTEIKEGAFFDCDNVTSLTFEGTAEDAQLNIRTLAFYGIGGGSSSSASEPLRVISLPANIGTIEQYAFGGIGYTKDSGKSLTVNVVAGGSLFQDGAFGSNATNPTFYVSEVNLGKDVESFSVPGVFGAVHLEKVNVDSANEYFTSTEEGVLFDKNQTTIAYFPGTITEYEIPATVTSVGAQIFRGKTALTKITIPASVASLGDQAFYGCSALNEIIFSDKVAEGTAKAETLTIGKQAFYNCKKITSFELPVRVTEIGDKAFENCSAITEIFIPKNVTKIGTSTGIVNVFDSMTGLTKITVDAENSAYKDINGILYTKNENDEATALCFAPRAVAVTDGKLEIPQTVSAFYEKAFYQNKYIKVITFPNGVTGGLTFEEGVFNNSNIEEVQLPEGLTAISQKMFQWAESLKKINIPTTVTSIENQAFYYCTSLEEITFADRSEVDTTLTIEDAKKGYSPFYGCYALKKLILPANTIHVGAYALYFYNASGAYSSNVKEVFIPNSVTAIGEYAFYQNSKMTTLTLEEGIALETISESAFYGCTAVKEFTIPESVTTIGKSAFGKWTMKDVVIPANVTTIGQSAFSSAKMETVLFAEGSQLSSIGSMAFNSCPNLTSITLPATVETIGSSAFANCNALTQVTFDTNEEGFMSLAKVDTGVFQRSGITSIKFPETTATSLTLGNNAFQYCRDLETVELNGQITSVNQVFSSCPSLKTFIISETNEVLSVDKDNMVVLSGGSTVEFVFGHLQNTADRKDYDTFTLENGVLTIKEGVEEINVRAFSQQTDIKKVIIPASVKVIGNNAFYACINLEEVEFVKTDADSVFTTIGTDAFRYCGKLKKINLPTTTESIGARAFSATGLEEIVLPASLNYTKVNAQASIFMNCYSLHTVSFEEGAQLEYLQNLMFQYCTALKNVTLPASLTDIGTSFQGCSALESIVIPELVDTMGAAFTNCVSLKKIHLPAGITTISAFNGCSALSEVTADGTITNIGGSAFKGCVELEELGFSTESVTTLGANAFQGCVKLNPANGINLPKVTSFGNYAFESCTALESVTVNPSLAKIGTNAFQNCTSLTEFVFPTAMTSLGNYAFQNTSLKSADLSATAVTGTNLGTYLFADCTSLAEVKLPTGITRISSYTFLNCTALKTVDIPAKVDCFQLHAFEGSGLVSIVVPKLKTVGGAGSDIFLNCKNLTDVTLTEGTILGASMFEGCTSLKSITIPKLAKAHTAADLFRGCTSLETVVLSESFNKYANYMFAGCTSLKSITGGNITEIGTNAFEDCVFTEYTIPATVTKINNYAFRNCEKLENITIPAATTSIGTGAFYGCTSLKKVTLGNGLKTIMGLAFANSSLESINIPNTVSSILGGAFNGCEALTSITFNNDYYKLENGIIYNEDNAIVSILPSATFTDGTLTVGEGQTLLLNALTDCPSVTKVVLSSSMLAEDGTMIDSMFANTTYIKEVVLPEGLTAISQRMFQNATALETVVIPNTVTMIEKYAFEGTTALLPLTLPDSITFIDQYAFRWSGISKITMPAYLETLGSYSFYECAALEEIIFPETVKIELIDASMFMGSGLKSFKMPDSVTTLGNNAFKDCVNLSEVTFSKNLVVMGQKAFLNAGLTKLTLPASITDWSTKSASSVFENCTKLETVVFEEGFNGFGDYYGTYVFRGCTALKSVTLVESMGSLPTSMFEGCTGLKEIYVPDGVIVGTSTFTGWTAEQKIYTTMSLREAMLTWNETWMTNNTATLVTDYVPATNA